MSAPEGQPLSVGFVLSGKQYDDGEEFTPANPDVRLVKQPVQLQGPASLGAFPGPYHTVHK